MNYYSFFSGVVESKNRQHVIAKNMMQITEILVEEGDQVKKKMKSFSKQVTKKKY